MVPPNTGRDLYQPQDKGKKRGATQFSQKGQRKRKPS